MTTNDTMIQTDAQMNRLEQRLTEAETRYRNAERRFRALGGLAFATVLGAIFLAPGNRAAMAQGYGVTLQQVAASLATAQSSIAALQSRATALESKTQFMSADTTAKSTTFSGCNVYVQNGLGATNGNPSDPLDPGNAVTNGLGNLIIGYNQTGRTAFDVNTGMTVPDDVRTGSHNLILGDYNNYSSYGGTVIGFGNSSSAAYAAVTGGEGNFANGPYASVAGGSGNLASGSFSTVTGGASNTAGGNYSSVSGGTANSANTYYASVSGGLLVTQSNQNGWSAGSFHTP